MSSYCLISEAWGNSNELRNSNELNNSSNSNELNNLNKFNNSNELTNLSNSNESNIQPMDDYVLSNMTYTNHESINSNNDLTDSKNIINNSKKELFSFKELNDCDCNVLLKQILECDECQEIIYNHLKNKFEHHTSNTNNILNSIFIGLFIIFILDTFVKIGKLFSKN